jgi:hypothetical protein
LDETEALAGPLPQVLLTRVNALRQARLWPEALRRSRELLSTHPNSTDAHLALGFIQLLQGQWRESVALAAPEVSESDPFRYPDLGRFTST